MIKAIIINYSSLLEPHTARDKKFDPETIYREGVTSFFENLFKSGIKSFIACSSHEQIDNFDQHLSKPKLAKPVLVSNDIEIFLSELVTQIGSIHETHPSEILLVAARDKTLQLAKSLGLKFVGLAWGAFKDPLTPRATLEEIVALASAESDKKYRPNNLLQREQNKYYIGFYNDELKPKLLKFKDGDPSVIAEWENLVKSCSDKLPKVDIIVRALGHNETNHTEKPLDTIARAISNATGSRYIPELLSKKATRKFSSLNSRERNKEAYGAYRFHPDNDQPESKQYLVIDDVLTTGSTLNEIRRAILEKVPDATVYTFTLCRTLNQLAFDSDKNHNRAVLDLLIRKGEINFSPRRSKTSNRHYTAGYSASGLHFVIQGLAETSIFSQKIDNRIISAISIVKNILLRGKPSLPSRYLRENHLLGYNGETYNIPLALIGSSRPEWSLTIQGGKNSSPAAYFYNTLIEKYFGRYSFIRKLIIPEIEINFIVNDCSEEFYNQRVDFYIPQAFLVIEIDGPQHYTQAQKDKLRDDYLRAKGIQTIRISTRDTQSETDIFKDKIREIIDRCENCTELLERESTTSKSILTLYDYEEAAKTTVADNEPRVFSNAIMRFQILILELLENGELSFNSDWKFFIIENDVKSFSEPALHDLKLWFNHIFSLLNLNIEFPKYQISYSKDNKTNPDYINIDFSMLNRFDDNPVLDEMTKYVRTHYLDHYTTISKSPSNKIKNISYIPYDFSFLTTSGPITYDIDISSNSKHKRDLEFLLANIFIPNEPNVSFREGQFPIVATALTRQNTLGLLPTGSGKSVCFQLAAFLQPAISFVICPIKSLMLDQKADLERVQIHRVDFINSDLDVDERNRIQRDFSSNRNFFVYIAPERFQTDQFRQIISSINETAPFGYAIIDEAHCLSEWGHDFRTSYLNLTHAVDRYTTDITYLGLTATASINVLKDLQVEFRVSDYNVITPSDFAREELSFHVVDDSGDKQTALSILLKEINQERDIFTANGDDSNCGIIFTQTVNGKNGCYEVATNVAKHFGAKVGYFSGSAPKHTGMSSAQYSAYKIEIQQSFKNNSITLLAATKAFGMGVNKSNVSFTIHYGIPGSMESLYQEAGRAGRDKLRYLKEGADSYVLLGKEKKSELEWLWGQNTTVKEISTQAKTKLSRESDLNTSIFFLTSSQAMISEDFGLIKKIYEIHYNSSQLTQRIESRRVGIDKSSLEKAVYRMTQLGIVYDWIVVDFINGIFEVEFIAHSDTDIRDAVEKSIRRYSSVFSIEETLEKPQGWYKIVNTNRLPYENYILIYLIWAFEHFFYNRKQSLKNVYENCEALSSGRINERQFKETIESYFKVNSASTRLITIAESREIPLSWIDFFISESDEPHSNLQNMRQLKDQLSRFLESYNDSPGLNILSGYLRLILDEFHDADGKQRFTMAVNSLESHTKPSEIIETIFKLAEVLGDDKRSEVSEVLLSIYGQELLRDCQSRLNDSYTHAIIALETKNKLISTISSIGTLYGN